MSTRMVSLSLIPLCVSCWASAAHAQEGAAAAPAAPASGSANPPEQVPVQIVADQPEVAVERRLPPPTSVCTPPCNATLRNGLNWLAVSYAGGTPIDLPVSVKEPSRLQVDYSSKRGLRTAGLVIFGTTFAAGVAAIVVGAMHHKTDCFISVEGLPICQDESDPNNALIAVGVGLVIAGIATGGVMFFTPDTANVNVIPRPAVAKLRLLPGIGARYERGGSHASSLDATGLRLRYEF